MQDGAMKYRKLFLILLLFLLFVCRLKVPDDPNWPFAYTEDIILEHGAEYSFPPGVYYKYRPLFTSNSPGAEEILIEEKSNGVDIIEAWRYMYRRPRADWTTATYYSPQLIIRLTNNDQPVDTLRFYPFQKPGIRYPASIRHYVFK